ncbi:hypothetical protein [Micromonospora sp. LOL_023]
MAWLPAIPHVMIVAALTGGWRVRSDGGTVVYVSGRLVAVVVC